MAVARLAPFVDKSSDCDSAAMTVTDANRAVTTAMESLFDSFASDAAVSVTELDNAKPSNRGGIQITGLLERSRVKQVTVDGKPQNLLLLSVLIDKPVTVAVQHVKATAAECDVVHHSDYQALVTIYKKYRMTAADRAKVAAKMQLTDKRTKGEVPHGLMSISTYSSIALSVFGASEPTYNGIAVTPGAIVKLNDVAFSHEYVDGALGRLNTHAATCVVERSDAGNSDRLHAAQAAATAYPPLWKWGKKVTMQEWPEGIVVSRAMEPAPDPVTAAKGSSDDKKNTSDGGGTDQMDTDGAPPVPLTRSQILSVPKSPEVELSNMTEFYIHFGESKQEAILRAQRAGPLSAPTVVGMPIVSRAKEAIEYKNKEDVDMVHGTVHVVMKQTSTTAGDRQHQDQIVLVLANNADDSEKNNHIEMLTGVKGFNMQRNVLRSFLAGMRGPMQITLKEKAPHDFESDVMKGTDVFSAYASNVSASMLPQTVPRAGFRVSQRFVKIRTAMMLSEDRIAALAQYGKTAYTHATGPSTETSRAIALRVSHVFGVFGESSNKNLMAVLEKNSDDDEKCEAAIAAVIDKAKGGLCKLTDHDFFAVGWMVPTPAVIEDQITRAADPKLIEENEAMIQSGMSQKAAYKTMIKESEKFNVPKEWSFYAVRREHPQKEQKRITDGHTPSAKRLAVEDGATAANSPKASSSSVGNAFDSDDESE